MRLLYLAANTLNFVYNQLMPNAAAIIRNRSKRRLKNRQRADSRLQRGFFVLGVICSLVLALALLGAALAYAWLTSDLPSIEMLPVLLKPPEGQLLQPTRIYDRTGLHLLYVLAPEDGQRGYLPLNPQNPRHLPENLANAVIVMADPNFWTHSGYVWDGWQNPNLHPTLAQRLVADLLLWNEPPTLRRALRERLLAAQITAHYGRAQVLEWYLNSAHYGHYAYGAEAAAQLYLGKSAADLNLAESALLAAAAQFPALNPLDAPQAAVQHQREILHILQMTGRISKVEATQALNESLPLRKAAPVPSNPAPAFFNLVFSQLGQHFPRARLERGGVNIFTTLDYDLQMQTACTVETQARRLTGDLAEQPEADGRPCEAARLLPALPPGLSVSDASLSAIVVDPNAGQILAAVGETLAGRESAILSTHPAGSSLTPFIYLAGFTRGLSPASLSWDVPGIAGDVENFDGQYHGPVRLRIALANDYLVPAAQVQEQMGAEIIQRTAASFGLPIRQEDNLLDGKIQITLLDAAGAYGALANNGLLVGQPVSGENLQPVSVLKVEDVNHSLWLDWRRPQTQAVVTQPLAYLMNHVLSDEAARWPSLGYPNPLEIGRPAAAKLGQTASREDVWVIGYTPQRLTAVWTGTTAGFPPIVTAGLWHALMKYAGRDLPPEGWKMPMGVTMLEVCDPSGQLPTRDCPNVVTEVFLNGNEPVQYDTLYHAYQVNRETGFLATVFTPPELIEARVYMKVPDEARAWAEQAGVPLPPETYDAIQPPPASPSVKITSPAMFADVRGVVQVNGTAAGEGFTSYRLLAGQGLNPTGWVQIGEEVTAPVQDNLLGIWDTNGLNGLYAIQLQVVRLDQRLETAVVQLTVDNQSPQVHITYPQDGISLKYAENRQVTFRVEADDNLSLAQVMFYLDGKLLGVLEQPPFLWTWTSQTGKHKLRVVAVDRAGNQARQEVQFDLTR